MKEEAKPVASMLTKKMSEVLGEVGWVPKNGYNDHHRYKFVREADLMDAIREKLAVRGVMAYTSTIEANVRSFEANGKIRVEATVKMEHLYVDSDSGEERLMTSFGHSLDTGDKALYKAITGAEKYHVMKLFMVSSGDDPENANPAGDGATSPPKSSIPPKQGSTERATSLPKSSGKTVTAKAVKGPVKIEGKSYVNFFFDVDGTEKKYWVAGENMIKNLTYCVEKGLEVTLAVGSNGRINDVL